MFPSKKLDLQHSVPPASQDASALIAHPTCSIQIPKYHHRAPNLQLQFGKSKPRAVYLIEILNWVVEQGILFTTLLRVRMKSALWNTFTFPGNLASTDLFKLFTST